LSRRAQIRFTDDEASAFMDEQRTVVCATIGRDGWPHLMPLWFVLREAPDAPSPQLWSWTYAASQKVRNLERDPRATLQVETGESYDQLRGVMLKVDVVIHRPQADVAALGMEIFARYAGGVQGQLPDEVRETVFRQAPKRVGLQFVERERATWDHRKLGGVY
jgi:hypothetical protein